MLRLFTTSLLLTIATFSHAQIGISVSGMTMRTPAWEEVLPPSIFADDDQMWNIQTRFGLDYWFRLKDYRVEFLPTLQFAQYRSNNRRVNQFFPSPDQQDGERIVIRDYSFTFFTNIYPFDFEGDCNCPTFGKDGSLFEKGFFLQGGIGASYLDRHVTSPFTDNVFLEAEDITIHLHIGAGIDFGVANLVTISPFIRYNYFLPTSWEVGDLTGDNREEVDSSISQIELGIRLGLRFDEVNY